LSEDKGKTNGTFKGVELNDNNVSKKVSCLRCRNFQVSSLIFAISIIVTLVLVFIPFTIDIQIEPYFVYISVLYGFGFAVTVIALVGGIKLIKSYCDEEQHQRTIDVLIFGFVFLFIAFALGLTACYYIPASIEEYPARITNDNPENIILGLSCRTFEMSWYDEKNQYMIFSDKWEYLGSDALTAKHISCIQEN